jgi:hypothetical protein
LQGYDLNGEQTSFEGAFESLGGEKEIGMEEQVPEFRCSDSECSGAYDREGMWLCHELLSAVRVRHVVRHNRLHLTGELCCSSLKIQCSNICSEIATCHARKLNSQNITHIIFRVPLTPVTKLNIDHVQVPTKDIVPYTRYPRDILPYKKDIQ